MDNKLRQKVLRLLINQGPLAFDDIVLSLPGESEASVGLVLGYLEAQGKAREDSTAEFKWAAVDLRF